MKIAQLIAISFIILGISLTIFFSSAWYYSAISVLETSVQDHLNSIAESRAEHIETYLDQNIERLNLVTSRNKLRNTLKSFNNEPTDQKANEMKDIILAAKESVSEIQRICVIGLDGKVITSTDIGFCGIDVSEQDFFKTAHKQNKIYLREEDGEIKIFVSGPFILENELIGVGMTVISTKKLEEIVKNRIGLGKTGEVLLAIQKDNEIEFIFDRLFEEESTYELGKYELATPMKAALNMEELVFDKTIDYRNKEVIAVSQYIDVGELGLVAKIDKEEVIGVPRLLYMKIGISTSILVLVLVIILSYVLGARISKDVRQLSNDVDKISLGNMNIELKRSKVDEIQSLTESLNRILVSMKLAILSTGKEFPKKIKRKK